MDNTKIPWPQQLELALEKAKLTIERVVLAAAAPELLAESAGAGAYAPGVGVVESDVAAESVSGDSTHVGAGAGGKEKIAPYNPSCRDDNCTAGVSAVIKSKVEKQFHTADDVERAFGYTGSERQFNLQDTLEYIEKATGLKAGPKPVAFLDAKAAEGYYAIVNRAETHVLYGRVFRNPATGGLTRTIYDPQSGTFFTYDAAVKKYGPLRPFLFQ
jgi:hypothetical protein